MYVCSIMSYVCMYCMLENPVYSGSWLNSKWLAYTILYQLEANTVAS